MNVLKNHSLHFQTLVDADVVQDHVLHLNRLASAWAAGFVDESLTHRHVQARQQAVLGGLSGLVDPDLFEDEADIVLGKASKLAHGLATGGVGSVVHGDLGGLEDGPEHDGAVAEGGLLEGEKALPAVNVGHKSGILGRVRLAGPGEQVVQVGQIQRRESANKIQLTVVHLKHGLLAAELPNVRVVGRLHPLRHHIRRTVRQPVHQLERLFDASNEEILLDLGKVQEGAVGGENGVNPVAEWLTFAQKSVRTRGANLKLVEDIEALGVKVLTLDVV